MGRDDVPLSPEEYGTWFQNPAIEETIFLAFFDKKRDGTKHPKHIQEGIPDALFVLAGTAVSVSTIVFIT